MEYTFDRFAAEARAAILATGTVRDDQIDLVTPKPNIPADLSLPVFKIAKAMEKPPQQVAQDLAIAIELRRDSLIGSVSGTGPFVNMAINLAPFAAGVLGEVERLGERYGHDDGAAGTTVVVDYSAPNIAKRMHVGHIRSTIIGQAIVNILRANGATVHGDNHLGDWGKQFGVVIAAVMRYGEPAAEGEAALGEYEELYTRYASAMKAASEAGDPTLDDEARAWSLRLEQGDAAARALWQKLIDLTMGVSQRLYDRLGVHIDHAYGESFYEAMLPGVIDEAIAKGAAYRDENGAVVVAELAKNLPTFLLQRSDGGTLYHTRDVATIEFRVREFAPDQIIYVVGAPQELHFRQLFALMKAMGYAIADHCIHIPTGTVFDEQGQALSTRKGNMIYLEKLLDEAFIRARAVVEAAARDLTDAEKDAVAEVVGVGGVIYNDLYQDPRRNITMDWDRMLALEGNAAPYIQYMYARCRSILRRAVSENQGTNAHPDQGSPSSMVNCQLSIVNGDPSLLTHPAEEALIKRLARLPEIVREAGARLAPFVVAEWCYETARALSAFYRDCQVLKAETPELRAARMRLVAATAQALKNGLALLSIRVPERM